MRREIDQRQAEGLPQLKELQQTEHQVKQQTLSQRAFVKCSARNILQKRAN